MHKRCSVHDIRVLQCHIEDRCHLLFSVYLSIYSAYSRVQTRHVSANEFAHTCCLGSTLHAVRLLIKFMIHYDPSSLWQTQVWRPLQFRISVCLDEPWIRPVPKYFTILITGDAYLLMFDGECVSILINNMVISVNGTNWCFPHVLCKCASSLSITPYRTLYEGIMYEICVSFIGIIYA